MESYTDNEDFQYGDEPDILNKQEFTQTHITPVEEKQQPSHEIQPRYSAFSWSLLAWLTVLIIFVASFIAIKFNGLFCPEELNNITKIKTGEILSFANFSGNACENFWEYACGTYTDTHLNESVLSQMQYGNVVRVADELRSISSNYRSFSNNPEQINDILNSSDLKMSQLGWFKGYSIDIMPDYNDPLHYAIYVTQDNTTTETLADYVPLQIGFVGCSNTELTSFLLTHSSVQQYMYVDETILCVETTPQKKYLWYMQKKSISSQLLLFWPERIGSVYQSILNPDHSAVLEMAQQIQSLAASFVNTAWWLDSTSKTHAVAKIKAITFHIGYGKTIAGDCTNNVSIISDYMTCSMKTFNAKVNALTSTPNPENDWEMSAIEVNAYYTPLFNAIYIPYGIAQMPLYDLQLHPLFNMAGLGAIIAHEIGHSIDPSGVNFDNRGNRVPWLSQTSKNNMELLEKCIEKHYDAVGVDNAQRTLNENFADLFSLSVLQGTNDMNPIRSTYLNHDSETFWLSWAQTWCRTSIHLNPGPIPKNTDVHAQARYRVLGMSTQSTMLKETFHCKKIETPICMVEDQS